MDIKSKLTLSLSTADATTFVTNALVDFLRETYGIHAKAEDIKVSFGTTMDYGPYDRGSGSPVFSGLNVTVEQATPVKRGAYADR